MGVHAPHSSSHVARLAGRGALTAAAALALTGGTASMAFAAEAPSVPTTHDIAGHAQDGAHELQGAAKKASLPSPSEAKSKLPTSLPISDVKTDGQHFASNTKTDAQHAATNWAAAAKGGITPSEASHQFGLMANDVQHAADNGKADFGHWSDALSS
jgi:hypothetical protein